MVFLPNRTVQMHAALSQKFKVNFCVAKKNELNLNLMHLLEACMQDARLSHPYPVHLFFRREFAWSDDAAVDKPDQQCMQL
jgi:hypothetical protein